jgi:TonB family protein
VPDLPAVASRSTAEPSVAPRAEPEPVRSPAPEPRRAETIPAARPAEAPAAPRDPSPAPPAARPPAPAPEGTAPSAAGTPRSGVAAQYPSGERGGPVGPAGPQVASLPPQREGPIDGLAALRRGAGAGGRGGGWGGITGDAISINSADARFGDYLERLRRAIQAKMVFPCIKDPDTLRCEPKDARLVVDMGLTRDGGVQVVEITRTSGMAEYDEVSVNAIKLAHPFPPVPAAMMAAQPRGATGVRITVLFSYMVTTWTQMLIR